MKGHYINKVDLFMQLGLTSFRLPANSELTIEQVDNEYRKVLVRVGKHVDWVSDRIMSDLVKEEL